MIIIPAIDLLGGKCVRLEQGAYDRVTEYQLSPVEVAQDFQDQGAEWLHVVDLDGARTGEGTNFGIISQVVSSTQMKVEVGGGIRSLERAQQLLDLGVARVVVGTKLVEDAALADAFFARFGESVVAGLDARNGFLATAGWTEQSAVSVAEFVRDLATRGGKRIILTDISRDGMLVGPNLDLLREVSAATSLPIIQSGGISSLADIHSLAEMGSSAPEAVIIGKALYAGKFTCSEAIQVASLGSSLHKREC